MAGEDIAKIGHRRDDAHNHGRYHYGDEEQRGQDLGGPPASEAQRGSYAVQPKRLPRPSPPLARSQIVLVTQVEDFSSGFGHDPVLRKMSVSEWRRGASRRNRDSASTSASRMASYCSSIT